MSAGIIIGCGAADKLSAGIRIDCRAAGKLSAGNRIDCGAAGARNRQLDLELVVEQQALHIVGWD